MAFVSSVIGGFFRHDDLSMAAAIAFYTSLSFAPLVLLLITVGGLFSDQTKNDLLWLFGQQLGPTAGDITGQIVHAASSQSRHQEPWRWWVGSATLLVTASGVFGQLQTALNRIWEVEDKPAKHQASWWRWIHKRLLSMGMVFSVLFILLISLVISTVVQRLVPSAATGEGMLARATVAATSFAVAGMLFAAMFKFLPDTHIPWRDVWIGAALTSVLFGVGKMVLSIYLAKGGVGEDYGKAIGGLIILLVWVDYSAVIFLLGAEVTRHLGQRRTSDKGNPAYGSTEG